MMTRIEVIAKGQIIDLLNKQGYPTYAHLFNQFHLNLTENPEVIAFMEPGKGRIVVNRNLSLKQISTIIRHEILHEYLSHAKRMERKLGKDKYDNRSPATHQRINIAADYEISNIGYTDSDKETAGSILLNGKVLKGLVTENDHPDWVDLSMEEMFDKLEKEMKDEEAEARTVLIQIGKKGSEQQQAEEDAKRAAEAVIDDADNQIENSEPGSQEEQEAKDVKNAAQKLKDELSSDDDKDSSDHTQATTSDENAPKVDKKPLSDDPLKDVTQKVARVVDISKLLDELGEKLIDETVDKVEDEKRKKQIKQDADRRYSPLSKFVDSLNQFIRKEIGVDKGKSYGKINKTYANTGIIRAGRTRRANTSIPLVNVYFDASASWGPDKIAIGKRGLATLDKYVKAGKLQIEVYYFGNTVTRDPSDHGGGTGAINPIFKHIEQTKADNVIVMTDGDMDSQGGSVSPLIVPGAVWFLFTDGGCDKLRQNLKGRKLTKEISVDTK